MAWNLPKGSSFLPEHSKRELKTLYKNEKNPKAKVRLLAAICRKEGKALRDIGELVEYPFTTIRDWLVRMHKVGIKGRYSTKQPGKKPFLSRKQQLKLKDVLSEGPEKQGLPFVLWTTKLVQYIILKLFDIEHQLWSVHNLIKKLDFGFKVPRPEHKNANRKAQEQFKKKLKQKYNIMLNLDSRSSVLTKHTSS